MELQSEIIVSDFKIGVLMYIKRHIESVVERISGRKTVPVLTGARQVGKLDEDGKKAKEQFYLIGLQSLKLMKNVSDSLAGRAGITEQLTGGAMWGHIFESFVFAEILKSYYNDGIIKPYLYYYRDTDKMVRVFEFGCVRGKSEERNSQA